MISENIKLYTIMGTQKNNGWITIESNGRNLPEFGTELILFNEKWIDEDFNPNGTRIGFRTDEGFTTAYWWDYQDTYMTISKNECENNSAYSKNIQDNTEPTHWMPIPKRPIL